MPTRERGVVRKWSETLTFQFAAAFLVFTTVTIAMSALISHRSMTSLYRAQCEERIEGIARSLAEEMGDEGKAFADLQHFLIEHEDELCIDPDFDDCQPDQQAFEQAFAHAYPGLVFGQDVTFDELDHSLQLMLCTYRFKYWQLRFEWAREAFGLPYTYYIWPSGEGTHVIHVFDSKRMAEETPEGKRMLLLEDFEEDFGKMPVMMATWRSGEPQQEVDVVESEHSSTCTHYEPLIIDGELLGLVCVGADLAAIDADVTSSTIGLVFLLSLIVILGVVSLIYHINHHYVDKLSQLSLHVEEYAREKDPRIAARIEDETSGHNEIALLSLQVASMISELQAHIDGIMEISGELLSAQERAARLRDLAHTDAMTGLGNKLAYGECAREMDDAGEVDFALIMIDLNFLKRLNDEYGHDKGDAAIRRLANHIRTAFPHGRPFRIGGDEFCVVLTGEAAAQCERSIAELRSLIEGDTGELPWEHLSAAIGYARHEEGETFEEVFKRADANMYTNKKAMKATRRS